MVVCQNQKWFILISQKNNTKIGNTIVSETFKKIETWFYSTHLNIWVFCPQMSHIITIFVQTHIFYPKNSDFWPKVIILYISLSNSKLGEKITTFEPTKI
jgi:hypothetical protein